MNLKRLGLGLLEGTKGEDRNAPKQDLQPKKKMHACMLPGPENWDDWDMFKWHGIFLPFFGGDPSEAATSVTPVTVLRPTLGPKSLGDENSE